MLVVGEEEALGPKGREKLATMKEASRLSHLQMLANLDASRRSGSFTILDERRPEQTIWLYSKRMSVYSDIAQLLSVYNVYNMQCHLDQFGYDVWDRSAK